jgi:TonB-dependent SusC/RagA subfamily outer membrane receptor
MALGAASLVSAQQVGRVAATDVVKDPVSHALEELLARPVTLDRTQVTLASAIDAVAAQAGVPIQYGTKILRGYDTLVNLHVRDVTLGRVLSQLLDKTTLRVVADGERRLALVDMKTLAATGTIVGHVSDVKTKRPLQGVSVLLDDSLMVVRTDESGRYRFASVSEGTHRIMVRAVGYARQTRVVTVVDGKEIAADFALASSVNTLDQVVVTATGAQRIRELGHVVAQINADSLVREAPITSLSELLTARVPGLSVYAGNGGVVGGDVALRLRGQTTTALDPQPIVIVDGIRYKNTNWVNGNEELRPNNVERRSPLNDLNVNDIETVEIVKGPSASALYGPDAANGVLVITTEHGKPGKASWHVYTAPDLSTEPTTSATQAEGYRVWGHNPTTGQILYNNSCTLPAQAAPVRCVLDSITRSPTIVNDPTYQVLAKNRPQWHSGVDVGGGAPLLTYFFSSNFDSETGALQLSPFAQNVLKSQLGTATLSDALENPNSQQTLTFHTSISSQINSVSTIGFVASYTQATQRAVNIANIYGATYKIGLFTPTTDTTNISVLSRSLPINAFLRSSQDQLRRVTASVTGTTRPWPWLTANGDLGADLSNSIDRSVEPVGAEGASFTGTAADLRDNNTGRNASLGLTAIARPGRLSFRTSTGVQYTYTNLDGLSTNGTGLAPGSTSIGSSSHLNSSQIWTERVDLGTYVEEVAGLNDRLFITGSLRLDGSTTFGDAYHARPYPKFGASWIVSDEPFMQRLHLPGLETWRLRTSFGAASRYPTSAMKNGSIIYNTSLFNDETETYFERNLLANPDIRPERTRETEYGTDLTIAGVQAELTWWKHRTNDQLNQLTVPYGFLSQWANVGDLDARGFEATVTVRPVESHVATVNLVFTYAHTTNTVRSLGDATGYANSYGSLVVGYPLGAAFGQSVIAVADTAGGTADGIIASSREYTLSPVRYLGVFFAPNVYSVTPVASLFDGHVRVSSLFDWQRGGIQRDNLSARCAVSGQCVAPFLTSTPLVEQARFVSSCDGCFIVSSDFTRWRELSVTADVPSRIVQQFRLDRASMSVQVRNLMLWTKWTGPDPESVPGLGTVGTFSALNGGTGIPQARSWALRFDVYP